MACARAIGENHNAQGGTPGESLAYILLGLVPTTALSLPLTIRSRSLRSRSLGPKAVLLVQPSPYAECLARHLIYRLGSHSHPRARACNLHAPPCFVKDPHCM